MSYARRNGYVAACLALVVTGCPGKSGSSACDPSLPADVHLTVDVLDVLNADSGPECEKIGIAAGDQFGITTGEPSHPHPEDDCPEATAGGLPEFTHSLDVTACQPQSGVGAQCQVTQSECAAPAGMTVGLVGDSFLKPGESAELEYRVRLGQSTVGCPQFSCQNRYRVSVTRLD